MSKPSDVLALVWRQKWLRHFRPLGFVLLMLAGSQPQPSASSLPHLTGEQIDDNDAAVTESDEQGQLKVLACCGCCRERRAPRLREIPACAVVLTP